MTDRIAYSAAFPAFEEPIGRVIGDKVYFSEPLQRLMETFFLRTGGVDDEIKDVSDITDDVSASVKALSEKQDQLEAALAALEGSSAATEQTRLVAQRSSSARGVKPTPAEAAVTPNDIVIVPLADGTLEYWVADAAAEYAALPNLTVEPPAAATEQSVFLTISRANIVQDVEPTAGEFPNPNTSSGAIINLNDDILEFWSRSTGAWVKTDSITLAPTPATGTVASDDMVTAFKDQDVVFALILGQSNGEGTGLGADSDAWAGPAANVKVLSTASYLPVAYNTSDNQLSRTARANTANTATELAKNWQARVDADSSLPDLVIIQVAYSGTGWTSRFSPALGTYTAPSEGANDDTTSLYYLTLEATQKAIRDAYSGPSAAKVARPVFIGAFLHGFESASTSPSTLKTADTGLRGMHDLVREATGNQNIRLFATKLRTDSPTYPNRAEYVAIQEAYEAEREDFILIDPAKFADPTGAAPASMPAGGFHTDNIHYLRPVFAYMAEEWLSLTVDAAEIGHVGHVKATTSPDGA